METVRTLNALKKALVQIRRLDDLEIPGPLERRLVILVAARLGRTRLIDNLSVDEALG